MKLDLFQGIDIFNISIVEVKFFPTIYTNGATVVIPSREILSSFRKSGGEMIEFIRLIILKMDKRFNSAVKSQNYDDAPSTVKTIELYRNEDGSH